MAKLKQLTQVDHIGLLGHRSLGSLLDQLLTTPIRNGAANSPFEQRRKMITRNSTLPASTGCVEISGGFNLH
jgi:hypothetical protein